uniref:Ig-like domain-containing protein n=1 Tax=Chrysemys picta bellii TaxID=8478 RepID=A0A8C3IS23_CHRPI
MLLTPDPDLCLCPSTELPAMGSRILGDSVTFPLGIPAEQLRTVSWTVNATRSLVAVEAGNPPNVIVLDTSYKGRVRVPESNSLQITSLRMEDTGTYSAQISTATDPSNSHVSGMTCVSETCNYNLSCTVRDGGDNVTYSWTHTAGGAVVANESILHISLSPRDAHLAVTCTAQNPVSNSSTTASAKDLCAGNSLCRIALPSAHRGELASGRCLCTSPRDLWAPLWGRGGTPVPGGWMWPLTPISQRGHGSQGRLQDFFLPKQKKKKPTGVPPSKCHPKGPRCCPLKSAAPSTCLERWCLEPALTGAEVSGTWPYLHRVSSCPVWSGGQVPRHPDSFPCCVLGTTPVPPA